MDDENDGELMWLWRRDESGRETRTWTQSQCQNVITLHSCCECRLWPISV